MESSNKTELMFDDFVRRGGGTLLNENAPAGYKGKIADYYFRNAGVIVELKCLQNDFFRDRRNVEKVSDLYEKWVRSGLVKPIRTEWQIIQSHALPVQCQLELLSLVRRPLRTAVEKANEQIKASKIALAAPQARGLLVVVNESNSSVQSDAIMYMLSKLLNGSRYSAIDHVIYLTIDLLAACPGVNKDLTIWVSAWVSNRPRIPTDFLTDFRKHWFGYLDGLRGATETILWNTAEDLNKLKFIRRLTKE